MVTKRIIPCLDVRNGRVVKGVNFLDVQDVSDPVRLADYYSRSGADELVFYDITASVEGRKLFTDILTDVASTIFIPLTVGGGISRLEDFERVLSCGADCGRQAGGWTVPCVPGRRPGGHRTGRSGVDPPGGGPGGWRGGGQLHRYRRRQGRL